MPTFEVIIGGAAPGEAPVRMDVAADHWMDAWRRALDELGEPVPDAGQVTCELAADGSVRVLAAGAGRAITVRAAPGADPDPPAPSPAPDPEAAASAEDAAPAAPPADDEGRARIKPASRRSSARQGVGREVPYAQALGGGRETSTAEALDMLRRHVSCEIILFLRPDPDGKGWRVGVARGSYDRSLPGLLLKAREPVPGPVEGGVARRTFAGDGTSVRFHRGLGRKVAVVVKSALWAAVGDGGLVHGMLLLLNARRDAGFTDGELAAVRDLAALLGRRLAAARA